jgi:hypothetical protein
MRYLISLSLLLMFCLYSTTSFAVVCNRPYALCDTSPCIPIPGMKNKAICFCSVFNGYSLGNKSCQARKPYKTKYNNELHMVSNYSFANMSVHKLMNCPSGTPWTFCLDKPCIVDPRNPYNTICTCDIVKTGRYVTFGGDCDTSTCGNTLYSGAAPDVMKSGDAQLMKVLNILASPVSVCPTPDHKW